MDNMRELLTNGFMVYPNNKGKFAVKKEAVPTNSLILPEQEFDSYDLAVEAALALLKTPQPVEWNVVVRYSRGLGIEYRNLPSVVASDRPLAEYMAGLEVAEAFGDTVDIREVKVVPKNNI